MLPAPLTVRGFARVCVFGSLSGPDPYLALSQVCQSGLCAFGWGSPSRISAVDEMLPCQGSQQQVFPHSLLLLARGKHAPFPQSCFVSSVSQSCLTASTQAEGRSEGRTEKGLKLNWNKSICRKNCKPLQNFFPPYLITPPHFHEPITIPHS